MGLEKVNGINDLRAGLRISQVMVLYVHGQTGTKSKTRMDWMVIAERRAQTFFNNSGGRPLTALGQARPPK